MRIPKEKSLSEPFLNLSYRKTESLSSYFGVTLTIWPFGGLWGTAGNKAWRYWVCMKLQQTRSQALHLLSNDLDDRNLITISRLDSLNSILPKRSEYSHARRKSTKINFLVPETAWWGGGSSTRRGGGRKVRALTRKFVFLGFRREKSGIPGEFCRDVPDPWGCSKSLRKKSLCAFFVPIVFMGAMSWNAPNAMIVRLRIAFRTSKCCNR